MIMLVFIFLISLIVISQADQMIMMIQSTSAYKRHVLLYRFAEMGVKQVENTALGLPSFLLPSGADINAVVVAKKLDSCGNILMTIRSVAKRQKDKLILQVHDIFARVPSTKGCEPLPKLQRLWWQEVAG